MPDGSRPPTVGRKRGRGCWPRPRAAAAHAVPASGLSGPATVPERELIMNATETPQHSGRLTVARHGIRTQAHRQKSGSGHAVSEPHRPGQLQPANYKKEHHETEINYPARGGDDNSGPAHAHSRPGISVARSRATEPGTSCWSQIAAIATRV